MTQPNQVNVDIENVPPSEVSPRNNVLVRLDSISRPSPTNRNNVGLGDRLSSVFREIRPLVEQHARMGNNRLSLPTWLPRNPPGTHQATDVQRPQSSIAHVNLGPNAQTYIVNERVVLGSLPLSPTHGMSNVTIGEPEPPEPATDHQEINVSVNPSNNNNIQDNVDNDSQSEDGTHQFLYDARAGLFAFFLLFFTFSHVNTVVKREHAAQLNRSVLGLGFELAWTAGFVAVVHYVFGDGKLLPNVVMFPAYAGPIDVWELIWLVVLTDLIVKIITVDVKILITMMPACLLPFQKRGKVYLFVESVSQLYRCLLTIQPWLFYLMQSYEGSEKMVGMFLVSIYVVAKLVELLMRIRLFKNATWTMLQSVNFGTKPTSEQVLAAGDACSICHDDFKTPVRLSCSHIFCEPCISEWFDREHTCPLCRASVEDGHAWRNGSTTFDFQLY
ncbi:RING finger and transmembrane domain-containing protein 2 [Leguminivora glycinivorella]|uniref:RING finger and transmembrane domain-containing protein 2 n=1 Tax=Leguminivora glycinivorella TaxID=1035111 RepID=UPI00200E417E|nr:RING finger and transmembrane domain-containing protein 2 [Leguminivora glycinivorella]